jgi:hypothetical protein
MGFASGEIGVGITSAATKMSLIIPVMFGIYVLDETPGIHIYLSLLLVVPAVLLMNSEKGKKPPLKQTGVILAIFVGSGTIDTTINLMREISAPGKEPGVILVIFASAFLCSLIIASAIVDSKREYIRGFRIISPFIL